MEKGKMSRKEKDEEQHKEIRAAVKQYRNTFAVNITSVQKGSMR